jgi:phosphate transport system permease protein
LYISHFTTPAFKNFVKPVIEIMAAVPSVVVGFLMLLWLGPLMARWIVAFMASLATIPITFVAFMLLWQLLRRIKWLRSMERGYEFAVLVPVILLGGAMAYWISPWLEDLLFQGDFKYWLFELTGKPYEALNSIVVAIGLGFAIIPIILSISEDALSSVPYNLTAASLALGASRWQTVWRVVLPSASPGVFAASMMGFGRAAGETMIVFMATGNTPIIDWSPFNGFRTLASNIAMEIGEAPHGESLYRILFLCAVILFLMTFAANTAAEVVRQRLRKKFGKYQ